jgi:hypothetical protein
MMAQGLSVTFNDSLDRRWDHLPTLNESAGATLIKAVVHTQQLRVMPLECNLLLDELNCLRLQDEGGRGRRYFLQQPRQ